MISKPLPQKTAKASIYTPQERALGIPNVVIKTKPKARKLNQRGSIYGAPPAPPLVGGNLRALTRTGGY